MMYAIAAITEKTRALGKDNRMLYHLPKDLQYFKDKTLHHSVVMGYRTYLSLPKRPLPQRKNIVLCNTCAALPEVLLLRSMEELLDYAHAHPEETLYICGGASLYAQCMPYVEKLFLTMIEEDSPVEADCFFPEIDPAVWKQVSEEFVEDNKKIRFTVWERR